MVAKRGISHSNRYMRSTQHACGQFRFASSDLGYSVDVMVAAQVAVARIVAAARHGRDHEVALVPTQPHGSANAEYGIVRVGFDYQDSPTVGREGRFHQLAKLVTEQGANAAIALRAAALQRLLHGDGPPLHRVPKFKLRRGKLSEAIRQAHGLERVAA